MAQVRVIEATYPNEDFVWYAFSHLFSTKLYLIHIYGKSISVSFEGAILINTLVELLAKLQVGVAHQLTDE